MRARKEGRVKEGMSGFGVCGAGAIVDAGAGLMLMLAWC